MLVPQQNVIFYVRRRTGALNHRRQWKWASLSQVDSVERTGRLQTEPAYMATDGRPMRAGHLHFTRGFDIDLGYVVEIRRTMIIGGARVAVKTALRAAAAIGAVSLSVYDTAGFEPGDVVHIRAATSGEAVRLKRTLPGVLETYSDFALESAYAIGDDVVAASFWRVLSMPTQLMGGWASVDVARIESLEDDLEALG